MSMNNDQWPSFYEIVEYLSINLSRGQASFYQFKSGKNISTKISYNGHIIDDVTIYKNNIFYTIEKPRDEYCFEYYKLIIIHEKTKEAKSMTVENELSKDELRKVCALIFETAGTNTIKDNRTPENSLLFKELIKGMKK